MDFNKEESLFVERYRPMTISECILKKKTFTEFTEIVKEGKIPNLLLYGPPGTGKTTSARALCNDVGVDYIIINASNDRGIDTIRDTITRFASTTSLTGRGKCIILDEFDHTTSLFQAAMRTVSEEFSKSCTFILTANYPNRIIPALHSRFVGVDFSASQKELEEMQAKFFMRCIDILKNEQIEFDERAVVAVVQKYFPDNRKILGVLQQYGRIGKIDSSAVVDLGKTNIEGLIKSIKAKKFKEITQWAADNRDNDLSTLYEDLYHALKTGYIENESIPDAVLILEDSQRYDSIVPSKELHIAAMCTQMMMNLKFKND